LGLKPGDPQPQRILELVLHSLRGELPLSERVSEAQMGAFFAAMTLRLGFGEKTRWSPAEEHAFALYRSELERQLPPSVRFLMDPQGRYEPENAADGLVMEALQQILCGRHLDYEHSLQVLQAVLSGQVQESLQAAVLIGQRMNLESYDEVRAYLDAPLGPEQVIPVGVESLTHLGEPFDGATRYFRPTLFVAAVRAALGRASILHGVPTMPPKMGVTEEAMLEALGVRTDLTMPQAASLIEDPDIGFAYVSQRLYAPDLYRLIKLRDHIKKRPPWATTEKAQQLFRAQRANYMVCGFYHSGYEETLLNLMWERGFEAALVIKGHEGTSHYSLRLGKKSDARRKAVNYAGGFHRLGDQRRDFEVDVDPLQWGISYDQDPRPETVSARAFAQLGWDALCGQPGPALDAIVLNVGMTDHLLGLCADPGQALEEARATINSGAALERLKSYIEKSQSFAQSVELG
jgi:anthranilate phosphoribosyltransferase